MDLPSSDSSNKTSTVIKGDNPIRNPREDVLGRVDVARSFARHVLALDASEGAVVGVLGPWGSGKTSFINLTRTEFQREGIQVFDFNPWMFSGAEHLVERFFAELATQFEIRTGLKQVGNALENYGEIFSGIAWVPLVGPWTERVSTMMKLFGKLFKRGKGGIDESRDKITQVLKGLKKSIIVVLDDVDRLSASELRDVFKLVRLTASFPNIIYIVACDRFRVEQALEEQGLSGRDYLEKIIQLPFDLPEVPSHILREQIDTSIRASLEGIENVSPLDEQLWPDIFTEIVRPLIRNMRDVRRYVATVRGTVISLDGQVALADVFGLEAVRVFLPDVFKLLPDVIESLTVISNSQSAERCTENEFGEMVPPERKTWRQVQVKGLLEAAKTQGGVVQAMIYHLFPVGMQYINGDMPDQENQWEDKLLGSRRIAHEDILRLYMERVVGGDLPAFYDAERAFARISDCKAFDEFIRSLDPTQWQYVIWNMRNFESQFRPEHVEPGSVVLFNLLPEWPDNNLFASARMITRNVAFPLLRTLKKPTEIEAAIHRILPKLTSLYSKTELVRLVTHQENDEKLVPEAAATEFRTMLLNKVKSMSVDELARECHLAWDFKFIKDDTELFEEPLDIYDSPKLTLALLQSATTTISSSDSHVSSRGLDWELLTELYDDAVTLKARIKGLNQGFENMKPWIENQKMSPDDIEALLELANRYLNGWRPY